MYVGNALLLAIGAALDGNLTGCTVHELEAPQGTAYRYLVIEKPTEVPDDLHDGEGGSYTVTLHLYDDGENLAGAETNLAEIDGLLHHAALTVTGASVWAVTREFTGPGPVEPEDGRPVTHTIVRYRIDLEAA